MSEIRVGALAASETDGLADRLTDGLGGAALYTASPVPGANDVVPTAEVFTEVLRGQATAVLVGLHPHPEPVQATRWRADADRVDRRLLAHCHGPTIDLGCGP
ncbi:MAG TPA: hypothetical protein VLA97_03080, partial [Nocardioidaceae bacterium]|nr:hypothetical protein [Nocardioidaceae bacterium]